MHRSPHQVLVALILVALPIGAVACSSPHEAVVTTEAVTTTTEPVTTSSSSTTTTSTTSTTSTTTTEPLPIPEPPPRAGVEEPVVELGTIAIPAIGITETLLRGISMPILDLGTGHWPGTAMPGHRGNVVVGGHRTSHRHPFLDVDLLMPGDEVIFTTDEGEFTYAVTGTSIVSPSEMWVIEQTDGYTATLFACHPKHSTRQRIIIHLELVTR